MVSPDSRGTACPLSGRNSTYRPVQISAAASRFHAGFHDSGSRDWDAECGDDCEDPLRVCCHRHKRSDNRRIVSHFDPSIGLAGPPHCLVATPPVPRPSRSPLAGFDPLTGSLILPASTILFRPWILVLCYRSSEAMALRTSNCAILNCRAMTDSLTLATASRASRLFEERDIRSARRGIRTHVIDGSTLYAYIVI
jgi:hypothetical protein